jgi:O-antigen/teichoic acid export membrane protein
LASNVDGLLLPILNIAVSLLVVRITSPALWGEFVQVMIVVQLGVHIMAWGNKEYLLRAFSLRPAQVAQQWQASLATRAVLLGAFVLVVMALGWPVQTSLLVIVWAVASLAHQAFDALIAYRRDFVYASLVEASGLLAMVTAIIAIGSGLSLDSLIAIFAVATLCKAVALWPRYERHAYGDRARGWSGRFDRGYFRAAFPFFLLGFSGMLQSRVDLYCVSLFLPRSEVGQYQVFINLLIYIQSIANFVLAPFIRTLYRLQRDATPRIAIRLFAFGLLLLPVALAAAYFVLTRLYQFEVSPLYMVAGAFFVAPIYLYLPIIYGLYRAEAQASVLQVNLLGIAANLLLNLTLLPRLGMLGTLLAAAAAQWLMLLSYLWLWRRLMSRHPKGNPARALP